MTGRQDPTMGDERFEHELRLDLARLAAQPAPESLVERVAAIPQTEPAGRRIAVMPILGGVASVALAAAAIVLLVSTRLGPWGPAGSSGPSGAIGGSSSAPASASAAPSGSASPSPSAPASPQPTPAASGAVAALPAGLEPVSMSFVSADDGWVLGSVAASGTGCGASFCAAVARTTDGGRTWALVGAPPAPAPGAVETPTDDVETIRFADQRNGWAFGPHALWATHDGGATWYAVSLPGLSGDEWLYALAAGNGLVHAALGNPNGIGIVTSPADHDAWSAPSITVGFGAGPVPRPQIVLAGTAGWMIEVDRTVIDGARLAAGTWRAWQPPCLDALGPALIAATDAAHLVAACDIGVWGPPERGEQLYASTDGGSTFTEVGALPFQQVLTIAAPSASTLVIGGTGPSGTPEIATSYDGGRTWPDVTRFASGVVTDLGFATATDGAALAADASGAGRLWLTSDGGRSWREVPAGS